MATQYSFTKGFSKGLVGAAIAGVSILGYILMTANPDIYNAPIADLVYKSLSQILGGMTVGGALTFVVNFIKVNYGS